MQAGELLQSTIAAYERLSSYTDDGSVTIVKEGAEMRTTFETRFARPSLFRFSFSSSHPYAPLAHIVTTHVCGVDGAGAYLWTKHHDDPAKIQTYEDATMAIASATGISYGSAHTSAQLLIGELRSGLLSLRGLKFGDDDEVEGTSCKAIVAKQAHGGPELTLSIDPVTMTLRKLRTRFADFLSEEIRRNIRLDQSVEASAFDRPAAGARR